MNLENKFLVSTMVPNHACHRNKHEGDQQPFMKTWTPCGVRRKWLKGLIVPSALWLSVGIPNCWDQSARPFNQLPEHTRLLTRSATGRGPCTQL